MKWKVFVMLFVLVFSLILTVPAGAATSVVAGDVSGTWDLAGSPYLVQGDITVPAGATLTIEPGVQVIFESWYALTVSGTLIADGTAAAPILFSPASVSPGWLGIRFIGASDSSLLNYAIVEKGRATGASPLNYGGGIYIENTSLTISNSTIRDNFAKSAGGGLYLSGSNASLIGNTISNNSAGQGGTASGAGIYLTNSSPEIKGNVIEGNHISVASTYTSPNGYGAGLYARSSNPTLLYNLFSGNTITASGSSSAYGAGLYLSYSDTVLTGNTFSGNLLTASTGVYSVAQGGGIYAASSDLVLVNNILYGDGPEEIYINASYPGSLTVGYTDIQGGQSGVVTNGAVVNLLGGNLNADPLFSDPANADFSLQAGSPAIDAGAAYLEWQGQVLVDLAASEYSGSAPDMGAIEFGGSGGTANQPPVAVASANPDHGSAPLTVQFSSAGSSDPDGSIVAYYWDFGDGASSTEANPGHDYTTVATYQAVLTVTDDDGASHNAVLSIDVQDGTTIWGGEVAGTWSSTGSPYRIEGDITVPTGQTLSIEPGVQVIFQSWYQFIVNGRLQAIGTQGEPILFSAADGSPGWLGIRFIGADDASRLSFAIVEKGHATGASPLDLGGGIYIENSSPMIDSSLIQDNLAKRSGGGLYLSGSNARLIDNIIVNNTAGQGGVASGAGIFLTNSSPELTGNQIQGNNIGVASTYTSPNGYGAGIYASNSNPKLQKNVITGNSINASGSSSAYGGALYLSGSDAILINNTISGNMLTASSGVYSVAEGGGIYAASSDPILVNNILWNDAPQEVVFNGSAPGSLTISHSDLQGGLSGILSNGATINWLNGNMDTDPFFSDALNGDFNLIDGSPAVDAGTSYFEWQGQVLINLSATEYIGTAPDMGAYESPYSGSVNQTPLATASATPENGDAPLAVQFSSAGSSDPDGSIVSYTWDFGTGDSSNQANPQYTFTTPGVYQVTLSVTDDQGATGSTSLTITANAPASAEIHVQDQTVTLETYSHRRKQATDLVLVTDQNNQPVAGVLVEASYSGPSQGQISTTTDANGIAVLTTDIVKNPKVPWCFQITSLKKDGYIYDPATNVVTTQCTSG